MAHALAGNTYNASFDPYAQFFTILMPDGSNTTSTTVHSIIALQQATVGAAIIFGVQIGMSGILMLVLGLMTKPEKRRSLIFFLNLAALLGLFIRSVLMCVALQGPFYNWFNWINSYYHDVDDSIRVSVAGEIANFLVIIAVELSLLFQVRIVCCTLRVRYRLIVTAVTTLVAVVVCGARFASMVVNIQLGIVRLGEKTEAQRALINGMVSASNISVICSIIFFSAIFCTKLGYAIHQRRTMGMKQFGPMQIIFVMGCQTMFIPVVFGILTYFVVEFSQIYSLMPMVVATFLPLSSMWASTSTKQDNIAAPHNVKRNRDVAVGPHDGGSKEYRSDKDLLTADTLVSEDSMKKGGTQDSSNRDSIDLEIQKMNIQVDRSYTVRSD